jgi:outer membrane lipoprotein SlyB
MGTKIVIAIAAALLLLQGCATSRSGSVYSRDEARREATVRMGVVESVRSVMIEGTKTPIGAGAGAVAGGVAGSTIGHGRGSAIGAVAGAVLGGVVGAAAEEGITRKEGVEITVRLDNGDYRAIVQEADEVFKPGERVRLVSIGGQTRVSH